MLDRAAITGATIEIVGVAVITDLIARDDTVATGRLTSRGLPCTSEAMLHLTGRRAPITVDGSAVITGLVARDKTVPAGRLTD